MNNPVGWFEIYVQDMPRARAFYEQTFQLQLSPLGGEGSDYWTFPFDHTKPNCSGALMKMEGKDSGGGGTLIYFSCQDCAVEAARAAEAGGRIFKEKWAIGEHGFISLVLDTEGNMIGLHSMA